ncbi:MAG: phosphotransferase family protein [Stellaceae bacterium]
MTDAELREALRAMGLLPPGETPRLTPLAGGVSSEIWRVDLARGPICLKRALAKLRTERDWFAPVERWRYEYAWFEVAGEIIPTAVPRLLGADPARRLFAMEFLDPSRHRVWKSDLLGGQVDIAVAAAVGRNLAAIHAGTAGRRDIAERFRSDEIFLAIRLDPYLGEAARRHPDLAPALHALIERTAATRLALIHGDVSPKNILIGPDGPVFLDAECACYGDPAFDLAFCLNHLLLKFLASPQATRDLSASFVALRDAYLSGVTWEPAYSIESRAASLLPGLLLARVDGKSPVEYVTAERDKELIRRVARPLLGSPPSRLDIVRNAWEAGFGSR